MAQNIEQLWRWLDELKNNGYETVRFAGTGRKTITQHAVEEYRGNVFGMSIVETESLEEAVSLTANWPELPYGGQIEILEAL